MRVKLYKTDFQNQMKKLTRKQAYTEFGEESVKNRIAEAKENFQIDPLEENSYPDGLLIEIEIN